MKHLCWDDHLERRVITTIVDAIGSCDQRFDCLVRIVIHARVEATGVALITFTIVVADAGK